MPRFLLRFFHYLTVTILLTTCNIPVSTAQSPNPLNHLAGEKSPYLLQHARNPVDWHPWNDAALAKATAENKLLVISVGYAACHWCHVMEEESFEDASVAALMNEHFISIKVDREERPDIDEVYMTACQLTNERGCGWPLNAIALPDGRPIWTGTYFPKNQWLNILNQFQQLKVEDGPQMEEYAAKLTAALNEQNSFNNEDGAPLSQTQLSGLTQGLLTRIDFAKGGLKGAPKFPTPALFEYLLTDYFYSKDERVLAAVTTTLDAMAAGGIYDHLAGGFARYATDENWQVPHFEKMLYDNAQLLSLYAKAFQVTGKERYAEVVHETINFLEKSLSDENGAFYASLDADTEGEEGKTYVWTDAEIDQVITPPRLAAAVKDLYTVKKRGNWEGKNILFQEQQVATVAKRHGYGSTAEFTEAAAVAKKKLLAVRDRRPQPGLDDKVLTSWNGLMISGYVDAFRAFGKEAYRERAIQAATFLGENLVREDGRLDRNFKDGSSGINAFLDDYGLLAQAAIDLYQITFDPRWLQLAEQLLDYTEVHFYDSSTGLYNYTSKQDAALISVNVPVLDKAIPAGNSIMARALHQYGTLAGDEEKKSRSSKMSAFISTKIMNSGLGSYANWARLSLELREPTYEVAILGADAGAMLGEMSKVYHPNALFLGGNNEGDLTLLKNKLVPGATTIYVCLEKVCQLPVSDAASALEQMK